MLRGYECRELGSFAIMTHSFLRGHRQYNVYQTAAIFFRKQQRMTNPRLLSLIMYLKLCQFQALSDRRRLDFRSSNQFGLLGNDSKNRNSPPALNLYVKL